MYRLVWLSCLVASAFGGERRSLQVPSPVLAQAAHGVERHRKGDAAIRLVRKDGTDACGVEVEGTQRTHDFAFGNVFRPRHYTNEAHRARFLELFNFIQLLEFNWGQYETEEGRPKLTDRMAFINGWCREHALTRFYGHMLVWSPQNTSPDRPNIPHWLFRYDRATQDRLLKDRIQREVLAYRDVEQVPWPLYRVDPAVAEGRGAGFHGTIGHSDFWNRIDVPNPYAFIIRGEGAAGQLGLLYDFFTSLPFWRMQPFEGVQSDKAVALAEPGKVCVIYLPRGGDVTVDLSGVEHSFAVRWFNPRLGDTTRGQDISGGAERSFESPFEGDAVLCLEAK